MNEHDRIREFFIKKIGLNPNQWPKSKVLRQPSPPIVLSRPRPKHCRMAA